MILQKTSTLKRCNNAGAHRARPASAVTRSVRTPAFTHQRVQRRIVSVRAATDEPTKPDALANLDDPEMAQDAIDQGLMFTAAGRWEEALALFEKALTLPGTGIKRFRDKPRGASDREKMTALYNIACCHSQMGDVRSGLVALAGCMEVGYADFPQIRRDPDLEAIRKDERFEGLIRRFEPTGVNALFGFDLSTIFGKKN